MSLLYVQKNKEHSGIFRWGKYGFRSFLIQFSILQAQERQFAKNPNKKTSQSCESYFSYTLNVP